MKLKNVWFVSELLGALGLVQGYKKNTQEWVRIQTAMIWLKSIGFARDVVIYQVCVSACVVVLVMSGILMEVVLIFCLSLSLQAKVIAVFIVCGIDFAVALSCLRYFLSSERWLKQAAKQNECVSELISKNNIL